MKPPPGKAPISDQTGIVSRSWLEWFDALKKFFFDGLVASRLVATDANNNLVDVDDLTSWIAGTSMEITVTDDGDGTVTLSLSSRDFGSLSATEAASGLTTAAVDTWYQIVSFTAEGSSINADPDPDQDHIEVAHSGFYTVGFMFTGHCAADHDWKVAIRKNNGAYTYALTAAYFSTNVADQWYTVTGTAHLYLADGDTVELWLMRLSAGTDIVMTIENLNLWLQAEVLM